MENNSSIENKPKKQKISPKKREKKEISPVGKGVFGDVYDKFKGKAKEAFNFLSSHGSGDLLGVFHRDDVGDIDVVWGDKEGGLDHIISKHVGEGKSFSDIDEVAHVIADIIKTGKNGFEDGDKIVFRKGNKLVTIRKNVRDKDKKNSRQELGSDGL